MTPLFKPSLNKKTEEIMKKKVDLDEYQKVSHVVPNNAVSGFWK